MHPFGEYTSSGVVVVAKKELVIKAGTADINDTFICHFQQRLLLYLKNSGKLTQKQYEKGLKLLGEKNA